MGNIKSLFLIGLLLVLAPFQFSCSGGSNPSTSPLTANNSGGSAGGSSAYSLAIDGSDNLYVLDNLNNRVRVYTGGSIAQTITGFAIPGQPTVTLAYATEIALDSADNIYLMIADQLVKYDPNGNYIAQITQRGNNVSQIGAAAQGLAIDRARGLIIVGDYQRFLVFNTLGTFLGAYGGPGNLANQIAALRYVGVDANGCVYGTDNGNARIDVWCPCGGGQVGCFNATVDYNFIKLFHSGAAVNTVVDSAGTLFTAVHLTDGTSDKMTKFNPGLGINTSWTISPPSDPQFTVVDSLGYVYEAYHDGLIVKYTNSGPPTVTIAPATQ